MIKVWKTVFIWGTLFSVKPLAEAETHTRHWVWNRRSVHRLSVFHFYLPSVADRWHSLFKHNKWQCGHYEQNERSVVELYLSPESNSKHSFVVITPAVPLLLFCLEHYAKKAKHQTKHNTKHNFDLPICCHHALIFIARPLSFPRWINELLICIQKVTAKCFIIYHL